MGKLIIYDERPDGSVDVIPFNRDIIMHVGEIKHHIDRWYSFSCPWPEMEKYFMVDARMAYRYARYALGCRWPEGEPAILTDEFTAIQYVHGVIKGRWPEAEDVIRSESWIWRYYNIYNGKLDVKML